MNELHLFAGAGGGILGGLLLGHRPVCAVEIEPYPRKVLLQRQRDGILPRFPIWDDINTFDGKPWKGKVDIVCGGFPCQDISAAGRGQGIDGPRSGLWGEMARVIREVGPRIVFVENSPVLTSRGLGTVLGDLAEMGYDATWCVLGGLDCGCEVDGKRIWIFATTMRIGVSPRNLSNIIQARVLSNKASNITSRHSQSERIEKWRERANRPYLHRNRDELAGRVDRIRAAGNGQIPIVAATAWRILANA